MPFQNDKSNINVTLTLKYGMASAGASWGATGGLSDTVMGRRGISFAWGGDIETEALLSRWVADTYRAAMPRKMRKAILWGIRRG